MNGILRTIAPTSDGVGEIVRESRDLPRLVPGVAHLDGYGLWVSEWTKDAVADAPRRVVVVRGARAEREDAVEIASLLGCGVSLVPAQAAVVVVPEGPTASVVPWPTRMRPVVDLTRWADGSTSVDVFVREQRPSRGGVRSKMLAHALPNASMSWHADADADAGAVVLRREGDIDPASLAASLSLDAPGVDCLHRLATDATLEPTAEDLRSAFALPAVAVALLLRQREVADAPGMVQADRLGFVGTIRESLLARPQGSSVVARMRRWDHDRPVLSVVTIVVAALLAGLAISLPFDAGHPLADGWPRILWLTAAAVLAVDALGSLVVLIAVRRRLRT